VGWSQRYTVGVWVGNAAGGPMWDVSGTSGAAPIWAAVMGYLHRSTPSHAPAAPPGLVTTQVRFDEALEASRSEWFLRDTQQPLFARDDAGSGVRKTARAEASTVATVRPRITAPAAGSIIALDPDIPPNNQRLSFTAEGADPRWRMDGQPFGRGASVPWLPWPGRHSVQLVSERGEVLDEIRIEVRGAGIKVSKNITKPGRLHQ
jgi:penicillin-binding protein 1C